ncbi:MAG: 4Fe-4S binding protein [Bacteroidetes bacterium]|jgi:polyferredoxin|nr:4Fe-4S binding protein [Bacteroidota bacterium]
MTKRSIHYIVLLTLLLFITAGLFAQERFPRPEFQTDYEYPENQLPLQRSHTWDYIDVVALISALSITSWLAIKKRSRRGLIWMSVFSLVYFGFFRQGCICSVGSVQNVALALFNNTYTIPLTALLFFLIPLFFALLFGRVFCAAVCPLGAIQELTGFRPVKLPKAVESVMIAIPFAYLALAVLFAAMESQFIICKYDPFIGIFRLNGRYTMIIFGVLLLIAGIFINRPYCRYLCPYGVLLNIFSRFAGKHLSITPAECINCRLCEEDACPYDAILPSTVGQYTEDIPQSRKRFLLYLALIPVFTIAGGLIMYNAAPALSSVHRDVQLAREIRAEQIMGVEAVSEAASAFKESGQTEEELFAIEESVVSRFKKASPWAGVFLGLSLGLGLLEMTRKKYRTGYKPHQGKCYSCGRCFKYCPVDIKTR